ncbi:3-deoxy-D-manno-octulosonate cytidylyltransferase [Leptolyngbya boryana NIES-2135]|jgi:3-deoxy-manno-octulosonate cytidylyltransferase (CMP-KDO synthetase)|uniref:3-deoxy-manno-octulosonate cytidylyltransferase n=1 Tax=Leptolyngbya boryana NIES-2135 TaxID=1973484 RepID=A0A1Z4JBD1_LEPBY|nr:MULTISPECIES: 3-deoxy-manno-octulosonate cytidylyltransferase [Leptolyngbya]BAY54095.1 3-deoxy-D-manno-octulosonate cytidylyltransferase [Leptolyngbya boryana NIES-2135]MBD2369751.1 3-deoxy-manno-octulosonate cytidylyltransferase [Leptolyngbya sp. FACHB-161]MBD2376048.1 3-deoxy-manno-octulosonate cytidylyltransferase [Leptolyngbya sp. FACHB-238]MBD2400324.1 3-deoxy-manno-octulosonate cytidylyltransferase [Leptolyngbya sp. FACHB-239]MBD2406865.1 3-deoxy-manno-octulosonate cytidylyltransferas
MTKILAVIPARYDSTRFPGKPLALIDHRPMVQWIYEAASQCPALSQVVVATDSEKIAEVVNQFGGKVEMTRSNHLTGTDRVAEVAARYPDYSVVVNVQGDQPFVTAQMLTELVRPYLEGETPDMTTLACPLDHEVGASDPNTVKVICDRHERALYFSRAPIPYYRYPATAPVFHHLGLYAFRRDFLLTYAQLTPTPLEQCEALEQLRVLEHGFTIRVCHIDKPILEINTPEDLAQAKVLVAQQL